jgi:predicted PurR-regulated permease PerM
MAITSKERERSLLLGFALFLTIAASFTLFSLWLPIILAIWTATLGRPLVLKLTPKLGGKQRAASLLVVLLLFGVLGPLTLAGVSLTTQAIDLVKRLSASESARNALSNVVSGGGGKAELPSGPDLVGLVREHGLQALDVVQSLAGATANLALGVFIFVLGVFALMTNGPEYYTWLRNHSPFPQGATDKLIDAFTETGRGLLVGVGLTGLAQGVVATIAYVVLGVPTAFVLGFLTCIASLIPSVGTAIIWVPVAAGLALTGRPVAAAVMAGVGLVVISSIDNLLRPLFVRMGELRLSTFALFAAMFGGIATFGAEGLVLGPLVLRLAKEALIAARGEEDPEGRRSLAPPPTSIPPPPPTNLPPPQAPRFDD